MWAEQPFGERRPRFRKQGPRRDGSVLPPENMREIAISVDVGGGTPGAAVYANLLAGEQAIGVIACGTWGGQILTVAPGWEILQTRILDGMDMAVITRTALVDEYVLVGTTGPEAHAFNSLDFVAKVFLAPMKYRFRTKIEAEGYVDPVHLHQWEGRPSRYHLRVLTSRGVWTGGWATPGAEHSVGGLLSAGSSFWFGHGGSIEDYLLGTWSEGTFYGDGGGGIFGPRNWVEWHIWMGAPE